MTANFGFIADAAETGAHELASKRTRNRTSERRLADARRTHEAQDRRTHPIARQFAHRQVLQDTLLDLFETVVILIEHLLRLVQANFGQFLLRPRQIQDPVEIGANNARFRAIHALLRQALEFVHRLLFDIVGRVKLGNLALQLINGVINIIVFTEFAANDAHLFTQEVLALALVQHFFGILLDLLAQFEQFELPGKQAMRTAQPLDRIEFIENIKPFIELEGRRPRNNIRQVPWLIDAMHEGDGILWHFAR